MPSTSSLLLLLVVLVTFSCKIDGQGKRYILPPLSESLLAGSISNIHKTSKVADYASHIVEAAQFAANNIHKELVQDSQVHGMPELNSNITVISASIGGIELIEDNSNFIVPYNQLKSFRSFKSSVELSEKSALFSEVKLGTGVLYRILLELKSGIHVGFQYVEPTSSFNNVFHWIYSSFPSNQNELIQEEESALTTTDDKVYLNEVTEEVLLKMKRPTLDTLTLRGPMHLYFPEPREDIRLYLPHNVEIADPVQKIKLNDGTQVKAEGISGLTLLNPVELDIQYLDKSDSVQVTWQQIPQLEVNADSNSMKMSSSERLKVKRKLRSELHLINEDLANRNIFHSMEFSSEDIIMQQVQQIISSHLRSITHSNAINTGFSVKRVLPGSGADAVTLVLLPMRLEIEGKNSDGKPYRGFQNTDVLVGRDVYGNYQLIYSKEMTSTSQLTFSEGMILNGTLSDAIENLQSFLKPQQTLSFE